MVYTAHSVLWATHSCDGNQKNGVGRMEQMSSDTIGIGCGLVERSV
jgi:hypothetical protein